MAAGDAGRQSGRDGRGRDGRRRRERAPGPPGRGRGVYMISVAAELAGMHPQTLRIYESRGLVTPKRSSGNTRLYSQEDVERLRRIQELTTEMGMNLAGVERVFELERELDRTRARMEGLERQAERVRREMAEEIDRVERSFRREIVRYEPPEEALRPSAGREPQERAPGGRVSLRRRRR